jgi:hypothetical protein
VDFAVNPAVVILRKYSHAEHQLSQKDIVAILKEESDIHTDRKSTRRNLTTLLDTGYPIEFTETLRMFQNKVGTPVEIIFRSISGLTDRLRMLSSGYSSAAMMTTIVW